MSAAPGPVRILRLQYSGEIEQIRQELRAVPGAEEISRQAVCREHESEFREDYVRFMGGLNADQRGLDWTLMPFTSKNPLSSHLCQNIFYASIIARLAAREAQTLWVLTHSTPLASQVASWGAQNGVRVLHSVQGKAAARRFLKTYSPAAIILAFFRTLLASALARSLRPRFGARESCIVVTTTMPQSSVDPSGYREAYFGPLVQHLARSGHRAVTVALIFSRTITTVWRLRRASTPLPVVPAEAYLTFRDIVVCAGRSLRKWAFPPGLDAPAVIYGIDVRPLLQSVIDDSCRSSGFFRHLSAYWAARRLTAQLPVTGWVYPFENRAMERALLLGARDADPRVTLVGCQNAALTRSHLNFMLGKTESDAIPLPDVVFTTGRSVRESLVGEGNFPPARVMVGCAFRQGRLTASARSVGPDVVRRVLVVLASSLDEYVEMLAFIADAFEGSDREQVRFRPHPEFPFSSAERLSPVSPTFSYEVSSGPLPDDLGWADVVLYASSTVSMEAVATGIPVVYVDVGHALNADPLFDLTGGLKWTAQRSADVGSCLRAIESLPPEEYQQRFRADREYVDEYFLPADAHRMNTLVEVARCQKSSQ